MPEHPELPPEVDFYEADEEGASVGYLEAADEEDKVLRVFRKLVSLIEDEQGAEVKQPIGFRPPPAQTRSRKKAAKRPLKRRAVQHHQKKQPRRKK